MFEIHK